MAPREQDLLRDLMNSFQAEAAEHLQTLNQALLQLERRPEEARQHELLHDAFRTAHSLKGAARAVGLEDIESLANAMESVLELARDGRLCLDSNMCDVLYDTIDAMDGLLKGQWVSVEQLRNRLSKLSRGETAPLLASEPETPVPALAVETAERVGTAEPGVPVAEPVWEGASQTVMPGEETIRVAVGKLDDLMAEAGELLVSKISAEQRLVDLRTIRQELARWPKIWREIKTLLPRVNGEAGLQLADVLTEHHEYIQRLARAINELDQDISRDAVRLGMVTGGLQDEVRRVRMVPFQSIVLRLQRAVRDAARSEGKYVDFHVEGGAVELDKKVLETLKDPLLHLLRNAVSHGIETPEARTAAGKPAEGRVVLIVQQRGGEVRITVQDNGRGFDIAALRRAARAHGGVPIDDNASDDEVISLAFLPGVTTTDHVTDMSGRGVGLDVVRQRLMVLQGRVSVNSAPGEGASVHLVVPVSLAMQRGLLVRAGKERYLLPMMAVKKIDSPRDTFTVEGRHMLTVDGKPLPLVSLAAVLARPADEDKAERGKSLAVVMAVAEQEVALLVDDVVSEQELAVKPLGKPLKRVRNVEGAAMLGNGEPIVILNAADLIQSVKGARTSALPGDGRMKDEAGPGAHILVVDDSITTRTLEKNILEAAGYQVTTATDGVEALKRLKEHPVDVIVADIQMPNMDGFVFTRTVRDSAEYSRLPVILVTSLESVEDRERGMHAGADAYIVKRGFDQAELVATIEQFL